MVEADEVALAMETSHTTRLLDNSTDQHVSSELRPRLLLEVAACEDDQLTPCAAPVTRSLDSLEHEMGNSESLFLEAHSDKNHSLVATNALQR